MAPKKAAKKKRDAVSAERHDAPVKPPRSQPSSQPEPTTGAEKKPILLRIPDMTLRQIETITRATKVGPALTRLLDRLASAENEHILMSLWSETARRTASPLRELTLAIEALEWATRGIEKGYWHWAFAGYARFLDYFDREGRRDNYLGLLNWARYRLAFVCLQLSAEIEEEAWKSCSVEQRRRGFRAADIAACYAIALHAHFTKPSAVHRYNGMCSWSLRARLRASLLFLESPLKKLEKPERQLGENARRASEASVGASGGEKRDAKDESFISKLWYKGSPLCGWRRHSSERDRREIAVIVDRAIDEIRKLAEDCLNDRSKLGEQMPDMSRSTAQVRWDLNPSDADPALFVRLARNDDDLLFLRLDEIYGERLTEYLDQLEARVGADSSKLAAFERIDESFLPAWVRERAASLPYFGLTS